MPTFAIESNGRLEKTAVYYNGQQLGGVKEIFLNFDEDGTADAVIQYEGTDKKIYTKNVFTEYFDNVRFVQPSFTEEESQELQLLQVESDGTIENSSIFYNDEKLEGVVELFIHIKGSQSKNSIHKYFSLKKYIPDHIEFKADITFRNEDNSIETESVF